MNDNPANHSTPVEVASHDLTTLRRSDLAAILAVYRRDARDRTGLKWLVFGVAGLPTAVVISVFAQRHQWPEVWGPAVLVGGWIPLVIALVVLLRRERALRARLQLYCPSCNAPFLDRGSANGISRADLAVASGCCQRCGDEVLARDS